MRWLLAAAASFVLGVSVAASSIASQPSVSASAPYPARLSEFGFFQGDANRPNPVLIPYSLKTPLFSDYADKQRFIFLPLGKKIGINSEDGRLQFPDGTILIKNFGYPGQNGKLTILETRLLLKLTDQWLALPYVWRADGSDADLKLAGTRFPVEIRLADGRQLDISYAVPNKNQCKSCHSEADAVVPLGPRIGNIVIERGHQTPLFAPIEGRFGGLDWRSDNTASLNDRARSYLDVNCAHCHRPKGSASNSGLFLGREIDESASLGIGKRPVAAGRGSGGFDFVIDPGHPERSILVHRMKSTDPGVAMPELGRATVHDEGVKLLEDWIRALKP